MRKCWIVGVKHGAKVWEEGVALGQVVPRLTANRVHYKINKIGNFKRRFPRGFRM